MNEVELTCGKQSVIAFENSNRDSSLDSVFTLNGKIRSYRPCAEYLRATRELSTHTLLVCNDWWCLWRFFPWQHCHLYLYLFLMSFIGILSFFD